MTDPCLAIREALFTRGSAADPAIADHLAACGACRAWAAAFTEGLREADGNETLTSEILLHADLVQLTCPPAPTASVWDPASAGLFPDIDPGPAFTARVLAATSRRDAHGPSAWRTLWLSLVQRPRFAFEAAYVLTLVFVLLAGNPLAAIGRTMDRAEPLVERIEPSARAIGARVVAVRDAGSGFRLRQVDGEQVSRTSAWLRDLGRRVAAPLSAWLTRLAAVVNSAAGWFERQFAEPGSDPTRSS